MAIQRDPWVFSLFCLPWVVAIFFLLDSLSSPRIHVIERWEGKGPTNGQVFWSTRDREFTEGSSQRFEVKRGEHEYSLPLPREVRWFRIDPAEESGAIFIRMVWLSSGLLPLPLESWGADRLSLWNRDPAGQLGGGRVVDGVLEMHSAGADPYFFGPALPGISVKRSLQILFLSLPLAFLMSLLSHAALIRFLHRPVWAPIARRWSWAVGGAFCGAAVGVAVTSYWQGSVRIGRLDSDANAIKDAGYELSFYDTRGRPISQRNGPLAMMLDPFTSYRNYPSQKSGRFVIDQNGFRDSGAPLVDRSVAFVVGGSMAFGWGASRDDETFVYRLNRLRKDFSFLNSGVVGFHSGQELAMMTHYLDAFSPRSYLLVDGYNDLIEGLMDRRSDVGFNHHTFDLIQDRLFEFASMQMDLLPPKREPFSVRLQKDQVEERIVAKYLENVARMGAFASARGARFSVALQPILLEKNRLSPEEIEVSSRWRESSEMLAVKAAYRRLAARASETCAAAGIPFVDLNADSELKTSSETFFVDVVHLSARGNEWVSRALEKFLGGSGRLPHRLTASN